MRPIANPYLRKPTGAGAAAARPAARPAANSKAKAAVGPGVPTPRSASSSASGSGSQRSSASPNPSPPNTARPASKGSSAAHVAAARTARAVTATTNAGVRRAVADARQKKKTVGSGAHPVPGRQQCHQQKQKEKARPAINSRSVPSVQQPPKQRPTAASSAAPLSSGKSAVLAAKKKSYTNNTAKNRRPVVAAIASGAKGATTTSAATATTQPATLKSQLRKQIADLKRAKIRKVQAAQAEVRRKEVEAKRKVEEEARKIREAEKMKIKVERDAERARKKAEVEEGRRRREAAREEKLRKVEMVEAKRYETYVRSEVAAIVAGMVSDVAVRNGEQRDDQGGRHGYHRCPPRPPASSHHPFPPYHILPPHQHPYPHPNRCNTFQHSDSVTEAAGIMGAMTAGVQPLGPWGASGGVQMPRVQQQQLLPHPHPHPHPHHVPGGQPPIQHHHAPTIPLTPYIYSNDPAAVRDGSNCTPAPHHPPSSTSTSTPLPPASSYGHHPPTTPSSSRSYSNVVVPPGSRTKDSSSAAPRGGGGAAPEVTPSPPSGLSFSSSRQSLSASPQQPALLGGAAPPPSPPLRGYSPNNKDAVGGASDSDPSTGRVVAHPNKGTKEAIMVPSSSSSSPSPSSPFKPNDADDSSDVNDRDDDGNDLVVDDIFQEMEEEVSRLNREDDDKVRGIINPSSCSPLDADKVRSYFSGVVAATDAATPEGPTPAGRTTGSIADNLLGEKGTASPPRGPRPLSLPLPDSASDWPENASFGTGGGGGFAGHPPPGPTPNGQALGGRCVSSSMRAKEEGTAASHFAESAPSHGDHRSCDDGPTNGSRTSVAQQPYRDYQFAVAPYGGASVLGPPSQTTPAIAAEQYNREPSSALPSRYHWPPAPQWSSPPWYGSVAYQQQPQQQPQQQQQPLLQLSPYGTPSATSNPYSEWVASASANVTSPRKRVQYPHSAPGWKRTSAASAAANKPKQLVLPESPLASPSPFATYKVLQGPIIITKTPGGSFGINLKFDTQSVLVDPPPLVGEEKNAPTAANNKDAAVPIPPNAGAPSDPLASVQVHDCDPQTSKSDGMSAIDVPPDAQKQPKPPRTKRRRRRRVFVSALRVDGADEQNAAVNDAKKNSGALQSGDIILAVNGRSVGGLTFQYACTLFSLGQGQTGMGASKVGSTASSNDLVRCALTVARPEVVAPSSYGNGSHHSLAAVGASSAHACQVGTGPAIASLSSIAPVIVPTIPFVVSEGGRVISGEFTDGELRGILDGLLTLRKYGGLILSRGDGSALRATFEAVKNHPTLGPRISRRDLSAVEKKLTLVDRLVGLEMKEKAEQHWQKSWKEELDLRMQKDAADSSTSHMFEYLTDAKRSALRLLPRPAQGCKCGGTDHELVNDDRCVLFRDLKRFVSPEEMERFAQKGTKSIAASKKGASTIESALRERTKKMKEGEEAERKEAMFVQLMEKTQISKGRAIFAPGILSVAIISAVATLNEGIPLEQTRIWYDNCIVGGRESNANRNVSECEDSSDEEDDEMDDTPLMALNSSHSSAPAAKRRKIQNDVPKKETLYPRPIFLAKIMLHISRTWGHLLKEPEHAEYAWQLKMNSLNYGESLSSYRRNPREPGSLSFESIQFVLDESMMSRLDGAWPSSSRIDQDGKLSADHKSGARQEAATEVVPAPTHSTGHSEATPNAAATSKVPIKQGAMDELLAVTILASQDKTGLYDEILALIRSEILCIGKDGAIFLRGGWESKVGAALLNDMWEGGWNAESDVDNRFCLHDALRISLPRAWQRGKDGWVTADGSGDIEYDYEEYSEIKRSFVNEYNEHRDNIDGVGKFGNI